MHHEAMYRQKRNRNRPNECFSPFWEKIPRKTSVSARRSHWKRSKPLVLWGTLLFVSLTALVNISSRNIQSHPSFPVVRVGARGEAVDLVPTIDHFMKAARESTTTFTALQRVYIVDEVGKLYVSQLAPNNQREKMIRGRARVVEPLLARAAGRLFTTAVFLVNYEDSTFCLDEPLYEVRGETITGIPILTSSRPVKCRLAFPMVSYATIEQTNKLQDIDGSLDTTYPTFENKEKRAVWRGSPTGKVRIDLCVFANEHRDLLDVELALFLILGAKDKSYIDQRDFQNYRAILDVDGASWSSRFGSLLCYSSVVLKYDPQFVDYFHHELKAYVHYIPVANFTDLLEKVRFVNNDANTEFVKSIIRNANKWCDTKLQIKTIENDMTTILNNYIQHQTRVNVQDLLSRYEFALVPSQ